MTEPTRFDLDARQRAMLAEMGVRVWWPQALPDGPAAESAASAPMPPSAVPAASTSSAQAAPVAASRPAVAAPAAAAVLTEALAPKPLAEGVNRMDWAALQGTISGCQACDLCAQRQNALIGVGDTQADWLVVGEAPSEDEDAQGQVFVGQPGQLLDNMLKAVGLSRTGQGPAGVYLTHAIKCRPPASRNPSAQELATCAPYLARQVALVQPKVILLMGRMAVQSVLQTTEPIGKLRGQLHPYQGVPVVVTYHPAYLLRNAADKAKAWVDLVLALKTVQG